MSEEFKARISIIRTSNVQMAAINYDETSIGALDII